jgi:hypothetical protein
MVSCICSNILDGQSVCRNSRSLSLQNSWEDSTDLVAFAMFSLGVFEGSACQQIKSRLRRVFRYGALWGPKGGLHFANY